MDSWNSLIGSSGGQTDMMYLIHGAGEQIKTVCCVKQFQHLSLLQCDIQKTSTSASPPRCLPDFPSTFIQVLDKSFRFGFSTPGKWGHFSRLLAGTPRSRMSDETHARLLIMMQRLRYRDVQLTRGVMKQNGGHATLMQPSLTHRIPWA